MSGSLRLRDGDAGVRPHECLQPRADTNSSMHIELAISARFWEIIRAIPGARHGLQRGSGSGI
jgi:hypothetical protein